ncbi:hypothetical protein TNCV_4527291 [Trichonephila clavipes]|nr:hypothetical protein TNCV_4527291 [Trichonephila clavipes]
MKCYRNATASQLSHELHEATETRYIAKEIKKAATEINKQLQNPNSFRNQDAATETNFQELLLPEDHVLEGSAVVDLFISMHGEVRLAWYHQHWSKIQNKIALCWIIYDDLVGRYPDNHTQLILDAFRRPFATRFSFPNYPRTGEKIVGGMGPTATMIRIVSFSARILVVKVVNCRKGPYTPYLTIFCSLF